MQISDVSARMEKCSEKTPTGAKRLLGSSHGADIPSESPPIYSKLMFNKTFTFACPIVITRKVSMIFFLLRGV